MRARVLPARRTIGAQRRRDPAREHDPGARAGGCERGERHRVSRLRVHDRHLFTLDHAPEAKHGPGPPLRDHWIDRDHLDSGSARTLGQRYSRAKREDRSAAALAESFAHPEQLSLPTPPFGVDVQIQDRERCGIAPHVLPPSRDARYAGSLYILNWRYTFGTTRPEAISASKIASSSARSSRCRVSTSSFALHWSRKSAVTSLRSLCSRIW